jgi:HPt (histidine-containing phosphotransfer) domain-containing protein
MSSDTTAANESAAAATPAATDDFQLAAFERRLKKPGSAERLLQGFVRDFGDAGQRLRDLLTSRDLDALAALVHSVKGSASYLSGDDLFALGDEIEHAARSGDVEKVQRALPGYADRIERLVAAARARLEAPRSEDAASRSDLDPQRIADDIRTALSLVKHGDYAATGILERIRLALQGTAHEPLARSAQAQFDELALDDAAATLNRLMTDLIDG